MTNEQANIQLYNSMNREFQLFKEWLLQQSPQEILNRSYEYMVKENIMVCMEEHVIPTRKAVALMKSGSPLENVFNDYRNQESTLMTDLRDTIECRADLEVERQSARREVR